MNLPRPSRSLIELIRENAIRILSGVIVAIAAAAWTTLSTLYAQQQQQQARLDALAAETHARFLAVTADLNGRYTALRERTDATAIDLGRRIDRLDQQTATISVHVLEIVRAVSRIEERISATRPSPFIPAPAINERVQEPRTPPP